MKLAFAISAILTVAFGAKLVNKNNADGILEMIKNEGYFAEAIPITTEDGYILQLIKMRRGVGTENEATSTSSTRKPVLLMHGFMSSAEDWVYGGRSQGLAFYLADKGYDVYLGNARGSIYGQEHTTLDPARDAAFWRYCWHEIGVKDLPAIIDKIMTFNPDDKIRFIGHMEGATAFYVLTSEKPEYNIKISKMVALGPIAFMQKATHPLLPKIAQHMKASGWIMKNIGVSAFKPSQEVIEDLKTPCMTKMNREEICSNIYFLFNGYNSDKMNRTTTSKMLSRVPSGGSIREVLHFTHLKQSGRFETFDYIPNVDQRRSREYDLSKISVPVSIFYAKDDMLSHVDDVKMLIEKLPNVEKEKIMEDFTNNLEMMYKENVDSMFDDVAEAME